MEQNKFFSNFNEQAKTLCQKLVFADFKDHIIETIEEMG